jgi:hypothetical protein
MGVSSAAHQSAGSIGSQPSHSEFDVLRLKVAPALDLGLIPLVRKTLEIFRGQLFCGGALPLVNFSERIVWLRSLIQYLRLMLNIGSYSRGFNFSGNKKRNHSNRTSCAARHENEKSPIGGKLSRPHFPSIGHLCFSLA